MMPTAAIRSNHCLYVVQAELEAELRKDPELMVCLYCIKHEVASSDCNPKIADLIQDFLDSDLRDKVKTKKIKRRN